MRLQTTYFLWPKLKPNMRLVLNRMHLQILSVRDMFVSKVAAHLIGLTTTGLTLALASRTNTDTDEGPGQLIPSVDMSVESSSRSTTPLSPIPESPMPRRAAVADVEYHSAAETDIESDNESVPSLEKSSPEADKSEADAASSPSAVGFGQSPNSGAPTATPNSGAPTTASAPHLGT